MDRQHFSVIVTGAQTAGREAALRALGSEHQPSSEIAFDGLNREIDERPIQISLIDLPLSHPIDHTRWGHLSSVDAVVFAVESADLQSIALHEFVSTLAVMPTTTKVVALTAGVRPGDLEFPEGVVTVLKRDNESWPQTLSVLLEEWFVERATTSVPKVGGTRTNGSRKPSTSEDLAPGEKLSTASVPYRVSIDQLLSLDDELGARWMVTGQVVQGCLRSADNGWLSRVDSELQISSLFAAGQPIDVGRQGMRIGVIIDSKKVEAAQVGDFLTPYHYIVSDTIYARLELTPSIHEPRSLRTLQVVGPFWSERAKIDWLGDGNTKTQQPLFAKLKLGSPQPWTPATTLLLQADSPTNLCGTATCYFAVEPRSTLCHGRWSADQLHSLTPWLEKTTLEHLVNAVQTVVDQSHEQGCLIKDICRLLNSHPETVQPALDTLVDGGGVRRIETEESNQEGAIYVGLSALKKIKQRIVSVLDEHKENLDFTQLKRRSGKSLPRPLFAFVLAELKRTHVLEEDGQGTFTNAPKPSISPATPQPVASQPTVELVQPQPLGERIIDILHKAKRMPPSIGELALLAKAPLEMIRGFVEDLEKQGKIVRLNGDLFVHANVAGELRELIRGYFSVNQELDIQAFKKLVGTSRKYCTPLLEYADSRGWTARSNDDTRRPGSQL